ncbi:hypothetical protein GCM10027299_28910 [Larkinella ripae]
MAAFNNDNDPLLIIAYAFGFALIIASAGWALTQIIPSIGVFIAIIAHGTVIGMEVAPAFGQVASWSTGIAGAAGATLIVYKTIVLVEKDVFKWTVGILSVVSGFMVKICDEYYDGSVFAWYVMSAIAALLTIVGGVLYEQKAIGLKVAAFFAHLLIPGIVLYGIIFNPVAKSTVTGNGQTQPSLAVDVAAVPLSIWGILAALLVISIILAIMAHQGDKKERYA